MGVLLACKSVRIRSTSADINLSLILLTQLRSRFERLPNEAHDR